MNLGFSSRECGVGNEQLTNVKNVTVHRLTPTYHLTTIGGDPYGGLHWGA